MLSYQKHFPNCYIKIDKCFILDIQSEKYRGILWKMLSGLQKVWGKSVAEGVETQTQVNYRCCVWIICIFLFRQT
ncbi:hypothetical protein ACV176_004824 [Escherichia coli]